jgi:hypothetical protein
MKTLQEQYNLIKEGKGHKGIFLTEAKKQFPSMLTNPMGFEEASKILKTRGVISENYIDLKPITEFGSTPKSSWENKFAQFLAEEAKKKKIVRAKQNGDKSYTVTYEDDTTAKIAVSNDDWDEIHSKYGRLTEAEEAKAIEKKTTKEIEETQSQGYNYKDKSNLDNQIGQEVLNGIYFEAKENPDKTLDEIRKMVAKNLAKDGQYYMKNAAFGVKGLGYKETEVEEVAGKYASSGYSDKLKKLVKESLIKENTIYPIQSTGEEVARIIGRAYDFDTDYIDSGAQRRAAIQTNERIIDWFNQHSPEIKKQAYDILKSLNPYIQRDINKYFNPQTSINENSDFEGEGLIVVGRTQIDNNEIADMVDEGDYYGVWNAVEGYWFFPESEENFDSLEFELSKEFNQRDINARIEGQFNENKKQAYDVLITKNPSSQKDIDRYFNPQQFQSESLKEATQPIQLNVVFKDTEDYIRAKEWFNGESDFYPSSEHNGFQTLSFEVADQADADATEMAIDQELQGSYIQSWSFELMENTIKESINESNDSSSYKSVVDILKTLHSFSNRIKFRTQDINGYYNIVYDDLNQLTKNSITALKNRKLWNTEFEATVANFDNNRINIRFEKPAQEILNIKDFDKKNWTPNELKESLNEEIDPELLDVLQTAMRISKEEGVVQHVNKTDYGKGYTVSDWYDSDNTVMSFEDGRILKESQDQPLKKKIKKESLDADLAEIDTQANIVAMEAKLDKISEMISAKIERLSMIEEDSNLAELVDKGKMKAMQKEIKILEKRKAKMEKIYEKATGKSYTKEIVDELETNNE